MEDSDKPSPEERLHAAHLQASSLVDSLQALTKEVPADRLPGLLDLIEQVQAVVLFISSGSDATSGHEKHQAPTRKQLQEFGQLLRDRRNAAGFSRLQLARRAKISDATVKFIETARHPPSRGTLLRLFGVPELKLTWSDAPGSLPPPRVEPDRASAEQPLAATALNCLLTPTLDPVRRVTELGRFLNGAGGHVDQNCVYLDSQCATAYLNMCQQSAGLADLRASTPLAAAAQRIVAETGPVSLQVIALGSGQAQLEVRLVQHLLELGRAPHLELCLLDISQPLLAYGQKHANDVFSGSSRVKVWGVQCDMHELPLYCRQLGLAGARPEQRRLFCMLGESLAHLEHELRFLQHTLPSASGDLLLLDMRLSQGTDPEQIKQHDKQWAAGVTPMEAAWLGGPIWRHCEDVARVDFHWELDTHLPMPGSYALGAVARVLRASGAEHQFSMFRYRRYAPDAVTSCLGRLGWSELDSWAFGGAAQPASLRLFCRHTAARCLST